MAYLTYLGRDYIAGNVTPIANVSVSLGQPQKRWKELYVDANSLHLGNVSLSIGKTGEVEFMKTNKLGQPVTSIDVANVHTSIDAGGVLTFYSANTTGNVSLGRGLAVGYVGEKVPGANLDVNGNAYISGATTIGGALAVTEIDSASTITLDAETDIVLDAKGGDIFLKDTGTIFGTLVRSGGNLLIKNGSSEDTVLTFSNEDTAVAGKLTTSVTPSFNYGANVTGNVSVTRSIAVGYTDGRVPQANLEVKGNTYITGATTIAGALTLGTDLAVAQGGTGASTLTDGGVLLGSGTSAITAMGVLTDGQMIVGDGSTDPVAESGATLRTSVGVGTGDTPQFYGANVTGNASINRSLAVGYVDGRVPQANLDVAGNVYIGNDVFFSGANYDLLWDETTSKLKFYDSAQACFGDGNDLQIYHGGTHSFIKNSTGDLRLRSDSLLLKNQADNETYLDANNGGSVDLYYDNTKKLETTGTGVSISGLGANVTGNVSVTRSM